MGEWRECQLGEVITLQRGHDLPRSEMVYGSIPVAGSNGVIGYHDVFTTKAPGITIGRSGNLGNAFFHKEDFWAHNTTLYVKDFKGNNELFIYYYLKDIDFKQFNVGSAVPTLNRNHIHPLDVTVPPLAEQKAIASVLSSLDDKIDLLHRQNKTLESMAETLFRQWFVEEAQDDWEDGCLGDISDNIKDGISHANIPSGTAYVGLEHIDRKSIPLNNYGFSDNLQSNKYLFQEDDILFGKLRPYFHKIVFAPFSGVCSTDILVIRAKTSKLFNFCLFAFYQTDVVEYANLGSEGTRMPRTNWNTLRQYPTTIPDESVLDKYNKIVTPSIFKIKHNQAQIHTLQKLRDTLLPKLMSGEVRVEYEN